MPNWTKVRLNLSNTDSDFDFTKDFKSFNEIIPMPRELRATTSGGLSSLVKSCLKEYPGSSWRFFITHRKARGKSFSFRELLQVCRLATCYSKYGYIDWYEWANDKWGVKWDMSIQEVAKNFIVFDTAWTYPEPVLEAFAAKFKDLEFTGEWAEEQAGNFTGSIQIKEGNANFDTDLSETVDCFERYFELWGSDDRFRYDEELGTYVEVDEEETA